MDLLLKEGRLALVLIKSLSAHDRYEDIMILFGSLDLPFDSSPYQHDYTRGFSYAIHRGIARHTFLSTYSGAKACKQYETHFWQNMKISFSNGEVQWSDSWFG